ncbi:MAG: knotted carbamoyltransferase YgeW [Phycisphaerae bacterium]|nr:knotted carbamoyltransferase YgeW [Phycisphaerae bacterium]
MVHTPIEQVIAELSRYDHRLHEQDFLLTWERSLDDLRAVLTTARAMEAMWRQNVSTRVFDAGLAISIFRDQSTRTRFSFAGAASLLGLTVQDFDETRSQIAHGETVRETANMISFLTEAIGIRDDIFIGAGHEYQCQVARALTEGHQQGVLAQRPAVINLQSDLDHPTQTLADLAHMQQTFGSLDALRGRRIAMTWAYSPSYGKPLSVAQGVIALMTRFGMHVTLAHPQGYDLLPDIVERAGKQAGESGGSFRVVHDMGEAFQDADVVYPKSWAPYSVMVERTDTLRSGNTAELSRLEHRCLDLNARHRDWECNAAMMGRTRDGSALYMHCLPADISGVSCPAGEVAADVFDAYRVQTYREAGYKPFIIAAMIMLARFPDVADLLRGCSDRRRPHRGT